MYRLFTGRIITVPWIGQLKFLNLGKSPFEYEVVKPYFLGNCLELGRVSWLFSIRNGKKVARKLIRKIRPAVLQDTLLDVMGLNNKALVGGVALAEGKFEIEFHS